MPRGGRRREDKLDTRHYVIPFRHIVCMSESQYARQLFNLKWIPMSSVERMKGLQHAQVSQPTHNL